MMIEQLAWTLACASFVLNLLQFWEARSSRRDHQRSIDRLLILGKSNSPGEAVASYERFDRIERAHVQLMEQRGAKARGADQGDDVARDRARMASWWGFRRHRPAKKKAETTTEG
jgi:hypothetical protein